MEFEASLVIVESLARVVADDLTLTDQYYMSPTTHAGREYFVPLEIGLRK